MSAGGGRTSSRGGTAPQMGSWRMWRREGRTAGGMGRAGGAAPWRVRGGARRAAGGTPGRGGRARSWLYRGGLCRSQSPARRTARREQVYRWTSRWGGGAGGGTGWRGAIRRAEGWIRAQQESAACQLLVLSVVAFAALCASCFCCFASAWLATLALYPPVGCGMSWTDICFSLVHIRCRATHAAAGAYATNRTPLQPTLANC